MRVAPEPAVTAVLSAVAEAAEAVEVVAAGDAATVARMGVALVGGAVRDFLLGSKALHDLDVVVTAGFAAVEALASTLRERPGFRLVRRHERFGTASLAAPGGIALDLAMARTETYPRPGVLPVVRPAFTLADDLARRDFTIHAIAVRIGRSGSLGSLLDPFGGQADLSAGVLRLLHLNSLADDPTRTLRAAHYAARLGLAVAPAFEEALRRSRVAKAWVNVSGDRLRRGVELSLAHPSSPKAIALLREWGALDDIVPGWGEAAHPERVFSGAGWASLLGPSSPTLRRAVAERLSFSRRLRRDVAA